MKNHGKTTLIICLILSIFASGSIAGNLPVFNVLDYGANPDGKTLCKKNIQAAVDACHKAGGGTVYLPAGDYLSGTIVLKDNVTFYLEAGATLWASKRMEDYGKPPAPKGGKTPGGRHLIQAVDAMNITVKGEGSINGNSEGDVFWEKLKTPKHQPGQRYWCYWDWDDLEHPFFHWKGKSRPTTLLEFVNCRDLRIKDITIESAPEWTLHPVHCDNVLIDGITIKNKYYGINTDGIDVDACINVMISNCNISAGDDAIVIKNKNRYGLKRFSRNITVTNCILSTSCLGFKIGTETLDGFENITFSNSVISNPDDRPKGICGIAIEMVDGADLRGVHVSNIAIRNFNTPIFIRLGNRGRGQSEPTPGTLSDVFINNISAVGCRITSSITGLPGHYIKNVNLSNIFVRTKGGEPKELAAKVVPELPDGYPEATMYGKLPAYGFYCRHVDGLRFSNVRVVCDEPDGRPMMIFDDVINREMN